MQAAAHTRDNHALATAGVDLLRGRNCAAAMAWSVTPVSARMPAARNGTIKRITCSMEVFTPKLVSAIARKALMLDMLNAAALSMKSTRQNSSIGGIRGAASLTSNM